MVRLRRSTLPVLFPPLRQYLGQTQTELVLVKVDLLQADIAGVAVVLLGVHLLRRQDDVALGRSGAESGGCSSGGVVGHRQRGGGGSRPGGGGAGEARSKHPDTLLLVTER